MADLTRKHRTGRTVAVVGGVAVLAWLLLRGRGCRVGAGNAATSADTATSSTSVPCRVRVDSAGIQFDGTTADLESTVDRCRTAGTAEVTATGAAISGVVASLMRALHVAGVTTYAEPALWRLADLAPPELR
jgi:predicted flap endonuclease-1-like 5' DNA nuclease